MPNVCYWNLNVLTIFIMKNDHNIVPVYGRPIEIVVVSKCSAVLLITKSDQTKIRQLVKAASSLYVEHWPGLYLICVVIYI